MIYKRKKILDDNEAETSFCKTPGLKFSETYVLTHDRFNTYLLLFFSDLDEAQSYKMPYRESPHHEIEKFMGVKILSLFKPNEHTEDFHIRKSNNKNFLFENEDEKYNYVGENLVSFETIDQTVNFFSELGFNKIVYLYGEESIYFMLYQKYIPIQEYETLTENKRVSLFL